MTNVQVLQQQLDLHLGGQPSLKIDITKESKRSTAMKYLNFSRTNKRKFQMLHGDISFKDLSFIPLTGKTSLSSAPSCLFLGTQRLSTMAEELHKTNHTLSKQKVRKKSRSELPLPEMTRQSSLQPDISKQSSLEIDITKESNRSTAIKFLNFCRTNKTKFREVIYLLRI